MRRAVRLMLLGELLLVAEQPARRVFELRAYPDIEVAAFAVKPDPSHGPMKKRKKGKVHKYGRR